MVLPSLEAAEILNESGGSVTVVNCRYLKPHDDRVLAEIVRDHRNVLVVEEGTVVNGFGAHMAAVIGRMDSSVKVVTHGVPDDFVDQAPRAKQLATVGLDARGIAQRASNAFGMESSRGTHLRAV
jgi:1-deoxy-D-xylulose-5-phosphate synthase